MAVRFDRAVSILDLLMQGKTPKQIMYELDVCAQQVTETKQKFPLLAPRKAKERLS